MEKDLKENLGNREIPKEDRENSRDKNARNASTQDEQLRKEDLPDSSNESKGTMGSGQRQYSN